MNPIYVPLLSALAGAIIGSLSSVATIWIQARIGDKREKIRQATTLALEELKIQIANAKPGTGIFPIAIYLHHQVAILNAIEDNDLTPERLRKIAADNSALIDATIDLERQFHRKRKEKIASE